MKLKSFGCSFIVGTDLSDIQTAMGCSRLTWPALIASNFGMAYHCHASGGCGNLSIIDRLSQEIINDPGAFFVVQWTYIDRFDYSDPGGHHFNQGNNDWSTISPGGQCPHSDFYFRNLHSEYRDKITSLVYIKTALDLLQAKNCKFVMTCLDALLIDDRYHISDAMREVQMSVNDKLMWFGGQDFLTWSDSQGFARGKTGHPLEAAHAAAAQHMMPFIDATLHRA